MMRSSLTLARTASDAWRKMLIYRAPGLPTRRAPPWRSKRSRTGCSPWDYRGRAITIDWGGGSCHLFHAMLIKNLPVTSVQLNQAFLREPSGAQACTTVGWEVVMVVHDAPFMAPGAGDTSEVHLGWIG